MLLFIALIVIFSSIHYVAATFGATEEKNVGNALMIAHSSDAGSVEFSKDKLTAWVNGDYPGSVRAELPFSLLDKGKIQYYQLKIISMKLVGDHPAVGIGFGIKKEDDHANRIEYNNYGEFLLISQKQISHLPMFTPRQIVGCGLYVHGNGDIYVYFTINGQLVHKHLFKPSSPAIKEIYPKIMLFGLGTKISAIFDETKMVKRPIDMEVIKQIVEIKDVQSKGQKKLWLTSIIYGKKNGNKKTANTS